MRITNFFKKTTWKSRVILAIWLTFSALIIGAIISTGPEEYVFQRALLALVVWISCSAFFVLPVVSYQKAITHQDNSTPSKKSWTTTLLLSIFLGHFGIHRFYTGRIISGVVFCFTMGGFGIGWIIDVLTIALNMFTDGKGCIISKKNEPRNKSTSVFPPDKKQERPLSKHTREISDRYISKSRIIAIVCLAIMIISIIITITNSANPTESLPPTIIFAVLAVVCGVISIGAPKTKKEAIKRKRESKNVPLKFRVLGRIGIFIGGVAVFLGIGVPISMISMPDPIERDGIGLFIVMAILGIILIEIGIKQIHGDFVETDEDFKWKKEYRGIYLSKQQVQKLKDGIELPVVDTPVFLDYGEVAVYYCAATRQERKNRIIGHTGGYVGGSVCITKGFSIHSGSSSSSPIYGGVSTEYEGELVLTNKRLIFLNDQKGFEVSNNAITAVTAYSDGISIQSGNHTFILLLPKTELAVLAFDGVRTGKIPLSNTAMEYNTNEIGCNATQEGFETNDISSIDGMKGHAFEYYCAELLRKNGFFDVKVTPGSGDQGVDILAEKGGVKYAIQCKNYATPLSNTPIQEVNAGKTFYGCHVGVVMTNSTFTSGAIDLAKATGVLLWDRAIVQKMMKS